MEAKPTYRPRGTEEDGFLYALGSVLHRFLPEVHSCSQCSSILTDNHPTTSFILERKYTPDSALVSPSQSLVKYVTAVDSAIERTVAHDLHQRGVISNTHDKVIRLMPPPISLTCPSHRTPFERIFMKKWVTTSLRFIVREKCHKINRMKLMRRKRKYVLSHASSIPHKRRRLTPT